MTFGKRDVFYEYCLLNNWHSFFHITCISLYYTTYQGTSIYFLSFPLRYNSHIDHCYIIHTNQNWNTKIFKKFPWLSWKMDSNLEIYKKCQKLLYNFEYYVKMLLYVCKNIKKFRNSETCAESSRVNTKRNGTCWDFFVTRTLNLSISYILFYTV